MDAHYGNYHQQDNAQKHVQQGSPERMRQAQNYAPFQPNIFD
jgi:hypothetical protein